VLLYAYRITDILSQAREGCGFHAAQAGIFRLVQIVRLYAQTDLRSDKTDAQETILKNWELSTRLAKALRRTLVHVGRDVDQIVDADAELCHQFGIEDDYQPIADLSFGQSE
jgi:hypothetical protein